MEISDYVLLFLVFCCIAGIIRNIMVFLLREKINKMCYRWSTQHLQEQSAYCWCYDYLPGYGKMMLSFKRLNIGSWLTKEQIEKLNDVHDDIPINTQ